MQGGREFSPCADEIRTFCQPSPVGEGGSSRLTDEVSFLDKATFPLSYFCVTKSTKSHQRERSPLFENSSRVHELVARAMRGKCVRQMAERKSAVLRSPQSKLYHACEHITRKSRADSCTHCLHARYKCRAGVNLARALTKSGHFASLLQWEKVAAVG